MRPDHARPDPAGRWQAWAVFLGFWGLLLVLSACSQEPLAPPSSAVQKLPDSGCQTCHPGAARGLGGPHSPAALGCVICHQGDGKAREKTAAHAGLDAFPGNLARAAQSCGRSSCHAEVLERVRKSPMATQTGLRALTRAWLSPEGGTASAVHARLASRLRTLTGPLGLDGTDDYLRKLCASCHLGQPRTHHGLSTTDRGGGCSACHLERPGAAPSEQALRGAEPQALHPGLTSAPDDARCFGCHSRSGRISLSYVGLVEVAAPSETKAAASPSEVQVGYLADGRPVAQREPDVHRQAGMGCIDCHTGAELMGKERTSTEHGETAGPLLQREALEIQCQDCHAAVLTTRSRSTLTPAERQREARLRPGAPLRPSVVVTEVGGTPLFQLEDSEQGATPTRTLLTRREGRVLRVPVASRASHRLEEAHARLTCESCHAGWAPWCEGCHIERDPSGKQWDHEAQTERPGAWTEKSWGVGAQPPALGMDYRGQVAPFVPGMHLTLGAGTGSPGLERRLYSRVAPHTTGKQARSCVSCHQETSLGQTPSWTGLHPGDRSLTLVEQERIRRVGRCLSCHPGDSALYATFREGLKQWTSRPKEHASDPHSGLVKKEKTR